MLRKKLARKNRDENVEMDDWNKEDWEDQAEEGGQT